MREPSKNGGIDFSTLALTAAASATAAYACSKVWTPGTLPSAAVMPVLVALLIEVFRKPTEVVSGAAPRRSSASPPAPHDQAPESEPHPRDRVPAVDEVAPVPYRSPHPLQVRWVQAAVTGVLGFMACVLVFTLPELIAGSSAAGDDRKTTLFGGQKGSSDPRPAAPPPVTVPAQTVTVLPPTTVTAPTPTVTVPPPATVTAPPPATVTAPPPSPEPSPPRRPRTTTGPSTVTTPPASPPPG